MVRFDGKIFIIGCGAVAQCSIPIILKKIAVPPRNITIIDPLDNSQFIADAIQAGVHFKVDKITKENCTDILTRHLKSGDVCIELANQVDTHDVLLWCQKNNVLYLNTCLNHWPAQEKVPLETLFKAMAELAKHDSTNTTAIVSHGANPGLISSFVKQGIENLAQSYIQKKNNHKKIITALDKKEFNMLAQLLGIETIHITEKDSQTIATPIPSGVFFNTWSTVEFTNECTLPTEFSWGTYEQKIPARATRYNGNITFQGMALNSSLRSWLPYEEFSGMIIPHDETYTIANYLSIGNAPSYRYRPTVLFVYSPCPAARESLSRIATRNFTYELKGHVIKREIVDGTDRMGCLLMGQSYAWWTGSLMSIQESNRLLPGHNATLMQIAAGVLSALTYMIQNPKRGICFPEQLDHEQILAVAMPYLGDFVSQSIQLTPAQQRIFNTYG